MAVQQFKTVKETIAKSAEGYPLLGYAIYWSISDVAVKYDAFVMMLENLGLPSDVATAVQAKSAAIKAIKAETKGRGNAFHRKAMDNDAKAGFAIVTSQTTDEENVDVQFQTETKVVLNKGDKTLQVDGPNADSIKATYEYMKDTYTSERFRNVILKLVKGYLQGMSIRERGGVYFVPSSHNADFEKLQALFELFPTCSLDVVPIIDTAQAKKSMWKTFTADITAELKGMQDDLHTLPVDASERSVQVRLDRYNSLRDKVEMYEILLNSTADDLKQELQLIGFSLKSRLTE